MKWILNIVVLLTVMVGCGGSPDPLALSDTSSGRRTAAHEALVGIDSLMWQQPDSALAAILEFAASSKADSLDEFEGHYCQVLTAELLFKNNRGQNNRLELLQAVAYFDSLVQETSSLKERRRDLKHMFSQNDNLIFLDARAHYINGAAIFENDSLVPACTEFLRALCIMEDHFTENELVGRKASFMSLTYNRLIDLFSTQLMQEPAIYCGQQSLHYNEIEPVAATNRGGALYFIGKQYHKLNTYDSAAYYFDAALEALPDTLNLYYRDIVSAQALLEFNRGGNPQNTLHTLKSMLAQATGETECISRYVAIGAIYKEEQQYDSAKAYWEPVFEKDPIRAIVVAPYLREIALSEGDTLKANLYAQTVVKKAALAGENQARVSQLNDLFLNYLNQKQARKAEVERRKAVKKAIGIVVPFAFLAALAIMVFAKRRNKMMLKDQQTEAQKVLEERDRKHTEAMKKQQDEVIQQVLTKLPQRVSDIYYSKVNNRMERIMAEFEAAYPLAMERLAAAYPDLNETERQITVLNFLQFRAKEEADLLGFAENTILKYRSNLNKKAGSDPISALLA